MSILIVGLNHQIQDREIRISTTDVKAQEFERDQKERFANLMMDRLRSREVQFVCEETRHGRESIVQEICRLHYPLHTYTNIEMPPTERVRRNIPDGYNENPAIPDEEKARMNREREDFMEAGITAVARGLGRGIVICGRFHVNSLVTRLERRGWAVDVDDLQHQSWYVEDWLDHVINDLW